jgi:hypothetical protein
VKLGKGLIPGANLWYAKAALDHMIFNQLQEYFSLVIFVRWNSVPAKSLTKHTGGDHRIRCLIRGEHESDYIYRNNLGAFLCYSYAFDKKGFNLEPQARAARVWFGFRSRFAWALSWKLSDLRSNSSA